MTDVVARIFSLKASSDFDFRRYADPDDDQAYLFAERLQEYRLKYAVCSAIKPTRILQIGSHDAYAVRTFFDVVPEASLVALSNVDDFDWSRANTAAFDATFLVADIGQTTSLPDEKYDLIHLVASPDGDATYRALELAMLRGCWILVDGCFCSLPCQISMAQFMSKYRQFYDYSLNLPESGGFMLFRTKLAPQTLLENGEHKNSQDIQACYDATYYLTDCGGFESFRKSGGRLLENERLRGIYHLVNPQRNEQILDLGCGRGELAYALAQSGAQVTGIDYSQDAITIANKTYAQDLGKESLQFICGDLLSVELGKRYNAIVAADVIEHVEQEALDKIFARCSLLLGGSGRLIINTSPNRWYLERTHRRRRQQAAQLGLYLPKNPRSYYEDLMHINEQNPVKLYKMLKKHFRQVVVWTANFPDLTGTLMAGMNRPALTHGLAIFAVAVNDSLHPKDIIPLLSQQPLPKRGVKISLSVDVKDLEVSPGGRFSLAVTVRNNGAVRIATLAPNPVFLSYHWLDQSGQPVVSAGERTPFLLSVDPGSERELAMEIFAPDWSGDLLLQVTLLQEGVGWLESLLPDLPIIVPVSIRGCQMREADQQPATIFYPNHTSAAISGRIASRIQSSRGEQKKGLVLSQDEQIRACIDITGAAANVGERIPPMVRFPLPVRRLALFAGKVVRFLATFITEEQRAFNHHVVQALRFIHDRQAVDMASPERIAAQVADLRAVTEAQGRSIAHLRDLLQSGNQEMVASATYSTPVESGVVDEAFYLAYENRFRGSRDMIKERMRNYVPVIRQAGAGTLNRPVLDLGCGRGEWLEVLREEGLVGQGNDQNRSMIDFCAGLGLQVTQGDLLAYLRALPAQSVGAVTAFQVAEHLPFTCLQELLAESLRVLSPGGGVIFEVPNPENIQIGSCYFYQDPTHVRPLPGPLLQFMLEYAGFEKVSVRPCSPHWDPPVPEQSDVAKRFNQMFYGPTEYAAYGWKSN